MGGGGHTAAILDALAPEGRVVGFDRDAEAIAEAGRRLHAEVESGRLKLIRSNFDQMRDVLESEGFLRADGLLLDLGVSSHQLDRAQRGFSHQGPGPLDMRMDEDERESAHALVNEADPADLVRILFEFGEEPGARRIVRAIEKARPLESTEQLADVVRSAARGGGPDRQKMEKKMLSRVFQALRIAVNRELEALETVLEASTDLIVPGGRLVVISYHSLEDRRVKRFLRTGNLEGRDERDLYGNRLSPWKEVTRKPIGPDAEEMRANQRSRSARLRIGERVEVEGGVGGRM